MARRINRRKKSSNIAVPNYREDSKVVSGPDPKLAIIALLLVVLLIGSGLYLTSIVEDSPSVTYGVDTRLLTDNHKTQAGFDTDFVVIIENTGSITDTYDVSVKSNDGGFTIDIEDNFESVIIESGQRKPVIINVDTSESSAGLMLYAYIEVKSRGNSATSSDIRLNVDTDHTFGNQTVTGNSVNVEYAGILARNANLFDTSMGQVWDNYPYLKSGVNPRADNGDLQAGNIGCDGQGFPSENCDGGRNMIKGFDAKMVNMYEGQILAVRIPAKDAYGESGSSSNELAGEDLIFAIEMVSIV